MVSRPEEKAAEIFDLKAELERACADLVYSSESDRPFEFFYVSFTGTRVPSIEEFRALLGIGAATRIEERALDEFFGRHTATVDPEDTEAYAARPRYSAMVSLLRERLEGVKVFRVGKIAVDCYVVGLDGNGRLAGLHTVAVET